MAGSEIVIANLIGWVKGSEMACKIEMDRHIKESRQYAKDNHPWEDKIGSATGGIDCKTEMEGGSIISTIGGDVDTPEGVQHMIFLETAWFFQGRYKILERARSNNIEHLWARIREAMSHGPITKGGI